MNFIQRIYNSLRFRYNHATRKKDEKKRIKYLTGNSKFSAEENIYLFTDPRSGSTWLMEILNQIPKTATLWEPFHPNNGTIDQSFKLGWRPYLERGSKNEELQNHLINVFSFKQATRWTVSQNRLIEYKRANTLIVKSVRANALLPWLINNIQFNKKPIYFLRHPVAQSISHIKAFSKNKDIWAEEKFDESQFNNSNYQKHLDFLSTLNYQIENRVAVWCLSNYQTINIPSNKVIKVFYEDLLLNPKDTLDEVFSQLNEKPINLEKIIGKPSWTSSKTLKKDQSEQLKKWSELIDENGKKRIERILDYFEVSHLYSTSQFTPIHPNKTEK